MQNGPRYQNSYHSDSSIFENGGVILLGLDKKTVENNDIPKSISQVIEISGVSPESVIFYAEGYGGQVVLTERAVIIGRKSLLHAFMASTLKGNKSIPYKSITAVQFKEPNIMPGSGYIRFTHSGEVGDKRVWEPNRDSFLKGAVSDENTVLLSKKHIENFRRVRDIVEEKINAPLMTPQQVSASNIADEIAKLANLKKDGLISDEEYAQLKSKLINK
jgi:hypothetical protein